jgi:predicted HTH domain antitoxin
MLSLGLAAKVADLPYGAMLDELGRRRIAVVRYGENELDQELAHARSLGDR